MLARRTATRTYYTETNLPAFGLLPGLQADSSTYDNVVPYSGYHWHSHGAKRGQRGLQLPPNLYSRQSVKSDLQYQVGYTYSHTNDAGTQGSSAGDLGTISNPYEGWKYDFGPSDYDIRHIFFTNFVYEIPLLKNNDNKALKTAFGGWEISGIVAAQSGAPLNVGLNGTSVASVVPNTSATARM